MGKNFSLPLSEATIRRHTSAQSFARGRAYERSGAVCSVIQRGHTVYANVAGSRDTPYQVCITFGHTGVESARCSCPYDWGGWCKHIVATLLVCLHRPDLVEQRPPVASVVAALSREELCELLLALIDYDPHLADMVETFAQGLSVSIPPLPTSGDNKE